ncbi:hypothetical protein [Chitinophaga deserti]|uniref:hypothetical protein n=1 Tax=Chitinophaga deserti TaxID=2164099 RepID=UPI000D6CC838|nr:hypothetical protein [Chitinophaga deserti]
MFKKQIWKGMAAAAIISTTFAACSKDDAPKKVYRYQTLDLKDNNNTNNGFITIAETSDSTFNIFMQINKSVMDRQYKFVVFRGNTASAPTDTLIKVGSILSETTGAPVLAKLHAIKEIKVDATTSRKFNYDSIINVLAFARISTPGSLGQDSTLALGNIGKSK